VEGPGAFYVQAVFDDDSPSPRAVVGRILGLATAGAVLLLLILFFSTGQVDWRLVAFIGVLWAAWGFIGGLFGDLFEPAGRFLMDQLTGNVALPGPAETLAEQAARFERMLAEGVEPHHEIIMGIRLAEIYRINQHDPAKAAALVARLRAKYPDAPELKLAGSD
jgi:hypothetical protein